MGSDPAPAKLSRDTHGETKHAIRRYRRLIAKQRVFKLTVEFSNAYKKVI
jgi:hypothetical protein